MRPDVTNWRCTNDLATLQFSPRTMLYRRLLGWIVGLLVLQVVLSGTCWLLLRALMPPQAAEQAPGATSVQMLLAKLTSRPHLRDAADFAICQLVALLLIQVTVIPVLRRRLAQHIHGMKAMFDAIRDLASGMTPRPLPAGQPGELGYLSLAFNDMASRLLASRKALVEANQNLEARVADRTRELSEAASKLDTMASTDALTGLSNRRHYSEQSVLKFERSITRGRDLVCLLIDLDNFKTVNDKLGHKMGDELLCCAAQVLRGACRGDDLVARLGGDEFLMMMEMDDVAVAQRIADRILAEFTRRSRELLAGQNLPAWPSMSIGISSRKIVKAITVDDVVAAGDSALYQAKGHGKSRAELCTSQAA